MFTINSSVVTSISICANQTGFITSKGIGVGSTIGELILAHGRGYSLNTTREYIYGRQGLTFQVDPGTQKVTSWTIFRSDR